MSSRSRSCLIMGGGVVGLSLAYELARAGWAVSLVERGEIGREASWAGAGILPPAQLQTAAHPLERLKAAAHLLHGEWAERLRIETGIDTGFRRCGGLYLAMSPGEAAALLGWAALLEEEEVQVERLSRAEVARIEPALASAAQTSAATALRLPEECQLRNPHHLRALTVACRQRNVHIIERAEVVDWHHAGGRVTAVHTTRGDFSADVYCVTAGAWTARLLEPQGISLGIVPIRGQMLLFKADSPLLRHVINVGPRYLVSRDDGHLLVGSTEEEAGFDKQTTDEELAGLKDFALRLLPDLRTTPLVNSWAGLRPGVYDGMPYMGPLPHWSNAYVAAGHFRSGLHLSPAIAVTMAALMAGQPPPWDLRPFRVSRA